MGGRGAGKTRAGAEWILDGMRRGSMRRVALVGATYADVREVMVEGESGLLTLGRDDGVIFESSKWQVCWPDGGLAQMFSAEEPDGLRGPQFDGAWADGVEGVDYVLTFIATFSDGQIEPVEVEIPVRRYI